MVALMLVPDRSARIVIDSDIGVFTTLLLKKPDFFRRSNMYLAWKIKIPLVSFLTYRPNKNVSSLIMLILNFMAITSANSLLSSSSLDPKMISPTYTITRIIWDPNCLINSVLSISPLFYPFVRIKVANVSYHTLGACWRPYKTLSRWYTWSRYSSLSKCGGCSIKNSSCRSSCRKEVLTSNW